MHSQGCRRRGTFNCCSAQAGKRWAAPPLRVQLPLPHRCLSDFALHKQLYKGKASTLYHATDKFSGVVVALKSYSKRRLSDLNWYQVERGECGDGGRLGCLVMPTQAAGALPESGRPGCYLFG